MGTVLVVQADPELNDGWCLALESSGHTVLPTRGTNEGILRIREGGIDVVVVDAPEGRDLSQLVDALHRLPDSPPFVLVSSSPDAPSVSARLGAAAFLPKPCSAAELEAAVTRLLPQPMEIDDEPTVPRTRRIN